MGVSCFGHTQNSSQPVFVSFLNSLLLSLTRPCTISRLLPSGKRKCLRLRLKSTQPVSTPTCGAGCRQLCARFPGPYWRRLDGERGYPVEFVEAMTAAGFLAALIPEEYGGGGATIAEASVILEEVNRSGGNAGVCHAQMYIMGALVRHGSVEQRERWLPPLAEGQLRLQAFGVTEPTAGSDTTRIQDAGGTGRRRVCDHGPEDLDEPGRVFGFDAAAGADDSRWRR